MILKAFALYDTKTGSFGSPFFMHHTGAALRAVADAAADRSAVFAKHPGDFAIFEIGTYDDQTGSLVAVPPHNLGLVASLLAEPAAPLPVFSQRVVTSSGSPVPHSDERN